MIWKNANFFEESKKILDQVATLARRGALLRAKDATGRAKGAPGRDHVATGRDMIATLRTPLGTLGVQELFLRNSSRKFSENPRFFWDFWVIFCWNSQGKIFRRLGAGGALGATSLNRGGGIFFTATRASR